MIMKKTFTFIVLALMMFAAGYASNIDVSGSITGTVNWTKDNNYYLDGFVFVTDGAVLNIEAGTVIRAYPGEAENASALIVKRGGKIMAEGTADEPIVFTSEQDNDLTRAMSFRGEWGGLILLGKALTNNPGFDNGIEGVPLDEEAYYGGDQDGDNSGVLKYVSIRHGGTELAPDEEINGLTMGAVGSGTTVDYVEVTSNNDDGIEFFGGSVNIKHFLVSDCSDDSYDIDEGFHGHLQFLYTQQVGDGTGDNFGEHDGGPSNNLYGEPLARAIFSNVTYIGGGAAVGDRCLTLREFFAGEYHNAVFANQAKGVRVEYNEDFASGAKGGTFTNWHKGLLKLDHITFQNVADGTPANIFTLYSVEDQDGNPVYEIPADSTAAFVNYFTTANNVVANVGVSKDDPVPSGDVSGTDFSGLPDWFENVTYRGAFDPSVTGGHWAGGWTQTFASVAYINPTTGLSHPEQNTFRSMVYPNPVTDQAVIEFRNDTNAAFTLAVYSADGRLVRKMNNIRDNQVVFTRNNLPAGAYAYTLSNGNTVSSGKLMLK